MKRFYSLLVICGMLAISGCNNTELESHTALGEIAIENTEPVPQNEPPTLMIIYSGGGIAHASAMTKGTHSWTPEEGDPYVADSIGPVECAEEGLITAVVDLAVMDGNPTIQLSGGEITAVKAYTKDGNSINCEYKDNEIILPDNKNSVIFSVSVKFERGTCDYFFMTKDTLNDRTAPPDIRIDSGEMLLKMTKGGYSWTYKVDDEHNATTIADSSAPYYVFQTSHVTVLNLEEHGKKVEITLPEDAQIESVTAYSDEKDEGTSVDFSGNEITLPKSPNGRVYCVTVVFPEGRCEYLFAGATEMSTPAYSPTVVEYPPIISENGVLYYHAGTADEGITDCGMSDGFVRKEAEDGINYALPHSEEQAEGDYRYQRLTNWRLLLMDGWQLYQADAATEPSCVVIDGKGYYNTSRMPAELPTCGTMDGYLTPDPDAEAPSEDQMSAPNGVLVYSGIFNEDTDYGYQNYTYGSIIVKLDKGWRIFSTLDAIQNEAEHPNGEIAIQVTVTNEHVCDIAHGSEDKGVLIESYDELTAFINDVITPNYPNGVSEQFKTYDERFFELNSLYYTAYENNTGSTRHLVDHASAAYQDGHLYIGLPSETPEVVTDDMAYFCIFVGLSKADIDGLTADDITLNGGF